MPTTLSMSQRKALADKHSNPYGSLTLLCDGRRITLQTQRASKTSMTYCVMTYVDGKFEGRWISAAEPCPEQKFMRRAEKRYVSEKKIAAMEKKYGKKRVAEYWTNARKVHISFMPYWKTYLAALNHLCRVCESVEVVEADA